MAVVPLEKRGTKIIPCKMAVVPLEKRGTKIIPCKMAGVPLDEGGQGRQKKWAGEHSAHDNHYVDGSVPTAAPSTTVATATAAAASAASTTAKSAATAAASATAATTATRSSIFTRARFTDGHRATVQFLAVEACNRRIGFFLHRHLDKCKTLRLSAKLVFDETHGINLSECLERLPDVLFANIPG